MENADHDEIGAICLFALHIFEKRGTRSGLDTVRYCEMLKSTFFYLLILYVVCCFFYTTICCGVAIYWKGNEFMKVNIERTIEFAPNFPSHNLNIPVKYNTYNAYLHIVDEWVEDRIEISINFEFMDELQNIVEDGTQTFKLGDYNKVEFKSMLSRILNSL